MVELTLKWDNFGLSQGLHNLMESQEFVDVTILCQGQFLQAHKNVLATCSQQFKQIFKATADKNPVVVLKGIKLAHMKNILTFMYLGEVDVSQDELEEFLATADELGVSAFSSRPKDIITRQQKPSPDPPASETEIKLNLQAPTQLRLNIPPPAHDNVETTDNAEQNETTSSIACLEIESHTIKEEFVNEDMLDEDWNNDPLDDSNTNTLESRHTVEHPIDGCYAVVGKNIPICGLDDPGPSTSQDGLPWHEVPAPVAHRISSHQIKRKRTQSPLPSPKSEQENPLQSDTPASQDFEANREDKYGESSTSNVSNNAASPVFQCLLCSLKFKSMKLRLKHHESAHNISIISCDFCQKVFKNRISLQAHRSQYHTGPQAGVLNWCEICGACFSQKYNLTQHIRNKHGDLAVPHVCPICNKTCKSKRALTDHIYHIHKKKKQNQS